MKLRNVQSMGKTTLPTGQYGNIRAMGDTTLGGGRCQTLRCIGATRVTDPFTVEDLAKITGTLTVQQFMTIDRLYLRGIIKSEEALIVREATIEKHFGMRSDATRIKGSFRAERLLVFYPLHLEEAEAKQVRVEASTRIVKTLVCDSLLCAAKLEAGEIEAEGILLYPNHDSSIKALHAADVEIVTDRRRFAPAKRGLPNSPGQMRVGEIEADGIVLERVTAERVSGQRIIIGPGCRIETLEYQESVEIHPESTVESTVESVVRIGGDAE